MAIDQSSATVLDVTDSSFTDEVIESQLPVLVDVWATWCGPCRLMAPLMGWAAEAYSGKLKVTKLEADGNPLSRDGYRIQGLPTLLLFRFGKEIARHEGAMAKPQLMAFLDAHL